MREDEELDELEEELRAALEEREEVAFAYLFGSRARGGPRARGNGEGAVHALSDVDVAVHVDPERWREVEAAGGWTELWMDLHEELTRRVARLLGPDRTDLVLLNRAPPLISERVVRNGRLLLSRDEALRIRWVVRTKSRYCDLRPLWRRLDASVAERLRSGRFGEARG